MPCELKPVESSNIAALGYDDADGSLHVRFKSGGTYRYPGVPRKIADIVIRGPGHGGFLHSHVKPFYQGVKLEPEK